MPILSRSELQDLVDSPNETLQAEYKEWLDLADNEVRADLARHMAALANHGGGAIVFGITDLMQPAGANPFPALSVDHDLIAGIVKRYLEPPFQCEVHFIRSAIGNDHPVVIVPPHGAVPICAKAGGPIVNGKPKGIAQGVHYTRKPGPESAPLLTAAEWAPIIRRCVSHERAAILAAIDAAIRGPGSVPPDISDALKAWQDAAQTAFLLDIAERKQYASVAKWHWQLSYAIDRADAQQLDPNGLLDVLRQVNGEVRDLVRTGWSMFHIFDVADVKPFFQTDPSSGMGDADFLECRLMRDARTGPVLFPDMWRVSPDGKATLIRNYWEDDLGTNQQFGLAPGTWFSPNMLVRSLAEFVRHARGLAERFNEPTTVSFRIEWHGLQGRVIRDPWNMWLDQWTARGDHRVAADSWPITMLKDAWPEIVANLAAPVMRAFTTDIALSPTWVRGQSSKWLSYG
jgi:Putative DNA-binding domain